MQDNLVENLNKIKDYLINNNKKHLLILLNYGIDSGGTYGEFQQICVFVLQILYQHDLSLKIKNTIYETIKILNKETKIDNKKLKNKKYPYNIQRTFKYGVNSIYDFSELEEVKYLEKYNNYFFSKNNPDIFPIINTIKNYEKVFFYSNKGNNNFFDTNLFYLFEEGLKINSDPGIIFYEISNNNYYYLPKFLIYNIKDISNSEWNIFYSLSKDWAIVYSTEGFGYVSYLHNPKRLKMQYIKDMQNKHLENFIQSLSLRKNYQLLSYNIKTIKNMLEDLYLKSEVDYLFNKYEL